jgi:hypothetical protein
MTNTQEGVIEGLDLASRLVEKTESKKLTWTKTLVGSAFTASVGSKLHFAVYATPDNELGLSMQDQDGDEILKVQVEVRPRYGYALRGEESLAASLERLFDLARRSALNVDQKVEYARSLLQSL